MQLVNGEGGEQGAVGSTACGRHLHGEVGVSHRIRHITKEATCWLRPTLLACSAKPGGARVGCWSGPVPGLAPGVLECKLWGWALYMLL